MASYLAPLQNFPPFQGDQTTLLTGDFITGPRDTWETYVWLVALGGLAAFAMAWSIGANDVANSFATSVGSKTLTLWQACLIAAVFEFTGAIALGGQVAKTISGGITSPDVFRKAPEIFAFGMLCALVSAATIVTAATYWSAAVSTTHSIIGAVLGFGLVFGGSDAIIWNKTIDDFPYRSGVVTVFMSWFIAPISAAIVASVIFFLNRTVILRRGNSHVWACWSLPFLILISVFINLFFVLYKGAGKELKWDKDGHKAAWVSIIVAAGCGVLSIPAVLWLKNKLNNITAQDEKSPQVVVTVDKDAKLAGDASPANSTADTSPKGGVRGFFQKAKAQLTHSLTMDVHSEIHKDETIANIHANAEVFDPRAESVYKVLQVLSACCVSFAHGSNDVANAIGPFAGIWYVYNKYNVSSEAETPKWILAMGGAGLVVGLATYGYKIISVLGVGFAKMTPSRGFSAELATSLTIAIASVYGLPVSTTQIIVGAEMGVGIIDGGFKHHGANWKLFAKTFLGWVIAFVASGFCSAALFSFGAFAPSINDVDTVNNYNTAMSSVMTAQLNVMNSTNLNTFAPANQFRPDLNTTVSGLARNLTSLNNLKKYGKINMYDMMDVLKNVTSLYLTQTVPAYNKTA